MTGFEPRTSGVGSNCPNYKFVSGMPDIELGVNDITRMGLEVVGRHDILPIPTEQWIRYEDIEFHSNVDKKEFESNDHIIKWANNYTTSSNNV